VSGRAARPGQYGGLLDLVVRLGVSAADLLIERLGDSRREVRFYATVCIGAIRPRSAVYALVERLFDSDYGVRGCAIEALLGYPARDLDLAMVRARHALHSEDLTRVEAAATAIAELGDAAAIPDLIDIVGRDAKRADHARRALVALTRHDLGTSERKWRRFWEEQRERHRIEWLIAALGSREANLRGAAFDDLRRMTGESFGAPDELVRRDRGDLRERWERWWNETGRRRFARDDDERHRPTAVLPVRGKD
jgi:HEAT repeat protein